MATKKGTNNMTAYGTFATEPVFDHTVQGKDFYSAELSMTRQSGIVDTIRVIVSEDHVDRDKSYAGALIKVTGYFRSRNYAGTDGKSHIALYLFATSMEFVDAIPENTLSNQIYIRGYICKQPVYRTTPSGKHIADVIVAIPRPAHGSDYIPCILWNDQARIMKSLEVGVGLALVGRVQSREYTNKKGENGVAYEVSVSRIADTIPAVTSENEKSKKSEKTEIAETVSAE